MIALYIRLSRSDYDLNEYKHQSNSVENQRKLLNDFLEEMPDLRDEYAEEFIDDGKSGTDFHRPAFQKMLALIKKGKISTVIVKDFSRFGRNYIECADYLETLFPFLGVRFISVTDGYDSGSCSKDRQLEAAVKNIVNSYYSQDLSQKITSTFQLKREKGEFFFNPPFGYVKDENSPGKILIDEEAAVIVRKIFSLACEGKGTGSIAKILNKESIPTMAAYNKARKIKGKQSFKEKSPCAAWTGSKIRAILKNEVYAGTYVCRKSRRIAPGLSKSISVKSSEKIPNNHPSVVSPEIFQKAQAIFKPPKQVKNEYKLYDLRSKVVCGSCGYMMSYCENIYEDCCFYCAHTIQTGLYSGCPCERFSEDLLNSRVFIRLKQWIFFLEAAWGKAEEAEEKRRLSLMYINEEKQILNSELFEKQEKKLIIYESFCDGEISREDFLSRKTKLSEEIVSIRAWLESLNKKEKSLKKLKNRRKPELDCLMEKAVLFENEKKLTRTMAEAFIEKVTVFDRWHIEITWVGEKIVKEALKEKP